MQKADIPKGLVYVSSFDREGFKREKTNDGFKYLDLQGKPVRDKAILKRIDELVIPPIWEDVWICKNAKGHVQAIGYDLKGRKQYIYHPKWSEYRQQNKFSQLPLFAERLPIIRERVAADLRKRGWPKERVLALTVKMLDEYYLRIGNLNYKRSNETYGLTTLRRKHLNDNGKSLSLTYKAKSGKDRNVSVSNPTLAKLIRETSDLPGYEVFRYIDEDGKSQTIDSSDVNEYIKELSEGDFTAKVFRTWGGSRLSIDYLEDARKDVKENPRRKIETALVQRVAKKLGNTVSICRDYYIHPKVLEVVAQPEFKMPRISNAKKYQHLDISEQVVLKILMEG